MNSEAVKRLLDAHAAGWPQDELADLYERLKRQIESSVPGWTATRGVCRDGSHVFIGSLGRSLVIMPDRSIWIGDLGKGGPDALISYTGMAPMPDGTLAFPPPNIVKSQATRIA